MSEFYTRHPFPPPVENLDRAMALYEDDNVRRAEFHLLWPNEKYRPDLDVLVAGCGTFQAAKYAVGHPVARSSRSFGGTTRSSSTRLKLSKVLREPPGFVTESGVRQPLLLQAVDRLQLRRLH